MTEVGRERVSDVIELVSERERERERVSDVNELVSERESE